VSTQAQVEVSYDVGNDFFRLWLDKRMNYTCGVWEDGDDLDAAQDRKLGVLYDLAHVTPEKRVLDIGCGWGANLEYLAQVRGVGSAHGISLSTAQVNEVLRRNLDGVSVELCDYRDFSPERQFDAVECICMMEHIASPEQVWNKQNLAAYRDFFRRVHTWTRPGAYFALQVILRDRVPRDPVDLREVHWATHHIFPGGISLRMEDVVKTVAPHFEIMFVKTRRLDYERTTAAWLRGLRDHEQEIRGKWGASVFEEYERYLSGCVMAFQRRYQSLAQFSLRRIGDT